MIRMRKERQNRNWTILFVAYQTGIGPGVISELECGKRKPYPTWAHRLSNLFGLSIEQLLEEVPDD